VRIAIVGSGVVGLLTAVSCASAGHQVSLFEQADIPSSAATSHDRHRVVRGLHLGDQAKTTAAVLAHHKWVALQHLLSARFYERVGALTVLPTDTVLPTEDPVQARRMLADAGSRSRLLGPDDLAAHYPQIRFPAGASAVLEFQAGVLLADRVLAACAAWLRLYSHTELHPRRRAVGIDVDGPAVRLADGDVVRADAVLIAVGPWTRGLLSPELADQLVLHRQSVLYCEVPSEQVAAWGDTPAIASLGVRSGAWLVPPVADTPLKLSAASACRTVAELEDTATPLRWRDHLVEVFSELLPGFRGDWLFGARDCYYLARAAGGDAMVAALGGSVLSFAACGGGSFKFAPLIAESLAQRLTGAVPAPTGFDPVDTVVDASPAAIGRRPAGLVKGLS
jgi:glycine/D-amino acid oxidase-like deaminating enzyme